jgi:hypothetical protein
MKLKMPLAIGLVLAGVSVPMFAHHSFGMFDLQKNMEFDGVVQEYNWENPHTHIIVKVAPGAKDPSTVGTWDIEGGAVNIMARQGWTRATFKAGDKCAIVAHPMKDGTKGASLFFAIMPDGTKLYHDIARPGTTGADAPKGSY